MYYRGAENGQSNNQNQAFEYLTRKFAGRGLAMQARISADSYGAENTYGVRGNSSAPLTIGEFERNYKSRSPYAYSAANKMSEASRPAEKPIEIRNTRPQRTQTSASVQENMRAIPSERKLEKRDIQRIPRTKTQSVAPQNKVRRAVKNRENETKTPFTTLAKNFRHFPVGAMLTVVICAVSLMFIVGSSVLMNDASAKYASMQDEIAALARQEDELLIALEVKNDLRVIEDIAVNKLGMVKKDLVTRQYIKLGDEDMIETFENEENNIGISTLLTAIKGGN